MKRVPLLTVTALLAVTGQVTGCRELLCSTDFDCGEREVCGPLKRCVEREQPAIPTCSTTADCADRRICVGGTCRFVPPCLNVSGRYAAYRTGSAADPVVLVLQQAQGSCAVASVGIDGGPAPLLLGGTLDPHSAFTPTTDGGCSAVIAGDETLKLSCPGAGGTSIHHLYAIPEQAVHPDRFLPTRCGSGVAPCDGRRCVPGDGGPCATTVACPINSAGIPQCSEVP
ncbi:MAG: hypothetical protein HY904_03460 [Deltaproteobacteria bacterium]|nr:hypothetical protein [Deltaproteobacteria bacterium]